MMKMTTAAEGFNEIRPIGFHEEKLPEFNPDWLPNPYRDYAAALALESQTTGDIPCITMLGAVSAAVQKKFSVSPKEGLTENLNLYLLVGAKPGAGKSTIQRKICRPFTDYEEAHPDTTLRVETATHRGLLNVMSDNNGCVFITSADGGILETVGRTRGNELDLTLKGFDGDEVKYNTATCGNVIIPSASMVVLALAQVDYAKEFYTKPLLKMRGLSSRFLPSFPGSRDHFELDSPTVPEDVKLKAHTRLAELISLRAYDDPDVLTFTPEAKQVISDFFYRIQEDDRDVAEMLEMDFRRAYGHVSKIAGVLHCMEYGTVAGFHEISEETAENAVRIMDYFFAHARFAFNSAQREAAINDANYLLRRLEEIADESESASGALSKRDFLQRCRGYFRQKADSEPAFAELEECGYIRLRTVAPSGAGRPSTIIDLNPVYFAA